MLQFYEVLRIGRTVPQLSKVSMSYLFYVWYNIILVKI